MGVRVARCRSAPSRRGEKTEQGSSAKILKRCVREKLVAHLRRHFLATLTDGMHAPLMSWLQQVCGSPPPSDASLAVAEKGTDAASFEVLRQRCQFIEHWANTIAQHGPDMEELIKQL